MWPMAHSLPTSILWHCTCSACQDFLFFSSADAFSFSNENTMLPKESTIPLRGDSMPFLSAPPSLWLDPRQGTWCSQLWRLLFCELTRLCFSVILLVCLLVIRLCTNFTPASLCYTMPSTQATLSRHVCSDKNLFLASFQNPPRVLIMKSN